MMIKIDHQTHYLIIAKTYQRAGKGRKGQRENVQTALFLWMSRVARVFVPVFAFVFALVCGQSRDFSVCCDVVATFETTQKGPVPIKEK